MSNIVHISRDDLIDGAAERRAIAAYRRDGDVETLRDALEALGWQREDIAAVARGGNVRTGDGWPRGH
jgi:uncharacterized protein YprB with RNaseH-like and TPR domain